MVKPFLKWVGGKSKLLDIIIEEFPEEIDVYYEPFLGGGSILFRLLEENKEVKKIKVNDINKPLIELYKIIKESPEEFMEEMDKIIEEYNNLEDVKYPKRHKFKSTTKEDAKKGGKVSMYYYYRDEYNKTKDNMYKSVLFLFLNKTCFRGLYRESKNGYNVPFGNYKNPSFYDKENILDCSSLLNKCGVEFYSEDYTTFLKDVNDKDFVYLDPPYYPLNKKSFTKYQRGDFQGHEELVGVCKGIKRFVHSNSKCEFNLEKYKEFKIKEQKTVHSINSKRPGKGVKEIMISSLWGCE